MPSLAAEATQNLDCACSPGPRHRAAFRLSASWTLQLAQRNGPKAPRKAQASATQLRQPRCCSCSQTCMCVHAMMRYLHNSFRSVIIMDELSVWRRCVLKLVPCCDHKVTLKHGSNVHPFCAGASASGRAAHHGGGHFPIQPPSVAAPPEGGRAWAVVRRNGLRCTAVWYSCGGPHSRWLPGVQFSPLFRERLTLVL